ncbi:MAG: hypothetical protein NXY57DRAFT_384832 [Lentinula lateritia]|nr:MAG: hypothetical protein NXY57DRAFT_384832 [Lentinula lateritia]
MVSTTKPCLFFAKNACNNGDQCRFSHDASLASPLRTVCPYYLKGDCRYGDNCLNDHSMTGQELQPLLCKFFIKGECNKGSECVFRHEREQVASKSPRNVSDMMDPQSRHKVSSNSWLSPLGNFNALQLNPTSANSSAKTNSDSPYEYNADPGVPMNVSDDVTDNGHPISRETQDDESHGSFPSIKQQDTQVSSPFQLADDADATEVHGDRSPQPGSPYEQPVRNDHRSTFYTQYTPTVIPPGFVMHAAPYFDPNVYTRTIPMIPSYAPISYLPPTTTLPPNLSGSSNLLTQSVPPVVSAPLSDHANARIPWCQRYFVDGNCPLGRSCRFRHRLTDEELQKLQAEPAQEVPKVYLAPTHNEHGANSLQQNKRECHFWKTNSCKKGANCPFLHSAVDNPGPIPSIFVDEEDHIHHKDPENNDFGWGSGSDSAVKWDETAETAEPANTSEWDNKAPSAESWGEDVESWGNTISSEPELSTKKGSEKRTSEAHDNNRRKDHLEPKGAYSKSSSRSRETQSGSSSRSREPRGTGSQRRGMETPPHLWAKDRKSRWDNDGALDSDKTRPKSSARSTVDAISADLSRRLDNEITSKPSSRAHNNNENYLVSPNGSNLLSTVPKEGSVVDLGIHQELNSPEDINDNIDSPLPDAPDDADGGFTESAEISGEFNTDTGGNRPINSGVTEGTSVTENIRDTRVDRERTTDEEGVEVVDAQPGSNDSDDSSLTHDANGQEGTSNRLHEHVQEVAEEDSRGMASGNTHSSMNWDAADDAWNGPNWGPPDPENYSHKPHSKLPCKAFGQGYCPFGESCEFSHVSVDNDERQSSEVTVGIDDTIDTSVPNGFDHNEDDMSPLRSIIRQSFHCNVKYGQNASPEQILTAFESDTTFVFDIPLSFSEDEFSSLVTVFGNVLEIQVEFPKTGGSCYHAKVKFSDRHEAEEAAKQLHESSRLGPNTSLRAYPNSKAPSIYNWHPGDSSSAVRISYPTPSRAAWVYFESMDSFKQAESLNGQVFNGRKIKISRNSRLKKQTHFPLRVEGLAVTTEKQKLMDFFKNSVLVEMIAPTYTDDPTHQLENLLRTCGELEEFAVDVSPTNTARAMVFARFSDAAVASRAIATLNDTEHAFLGGGRLKVQGTFYSCYRLPQEKASAVRADINSLQTIHGPGIKVQEHINSVDDFELRIYGSDPILFAKARLEFDQLMGGEIILDDDNKPLWDDYFDLPSSTKQIDLLNTRNASSFFIERDFRNRHVLAFGSKERRPRAKDLLHKFLAKVQSCVLTMGVSDACMGHMIRAGYTNETALSDKLHFEFSSKTITIRGSVDEREKEWATISKFTRENDASPTVVDEQSCRLCLSIVVEPVLLGCEHKFCQPCLSLWFKSLINPNFTQMACIAAIDLDNSNDGEAETPRCSAPIPYSVIRKVLSNQEENDLLEHSFLSHVWERSEEYKLCPTRDCTMVYRVGSPGTLIHCPACRKWICSSCHVELHEGLSCSQYIGLTRRITDTQEI